MFNRFWVILIKQLSYSRKLKKLIMVNKCNFYYWLRDSIYSKSMKLKTNKKKNLLMKNKSFYLKLKKP